MYEVYDVVINRPWMTISHTHKLVISFHLKQLEFAGNNSYLLQHALNHLHEKLNLVVVSVVSAVSSADEYFRVVTVPRADKPAEVPEGHNLLTSTADPQFDDDPTGIPNRSSESPFGI